MQINIYIYIYIKFPHKSFIQMQFLFCLIHVASGSLKIYLGCDVMLENKICYDISYFKNKNTL